MRTKEKGITLIALVVTIVLLLVLASVSLNMVFNENIVGRAKEAANTYGQTSREESDVMNQMSKYIDASIKSKQYIGMSSANFLNSNEKYFSDKSIKTLKSWGANTMRLCFVPSYYADESDGIMKFDSTLGKYVLLEDKYNVEIEKLYAAIDTLIANDMYVIVNYHTIYQGNNGHLLDTQKDIAKKFFSDVVAKYPNLDNIIYEINNEDNEEWSSIAKYAKYIIPTIRQTSPNALIIVGTPAYDGNPHDVQTDSTKEDYLNYKNLMYACHVYPDKSSWQTSNLKRALEKNIPVFITEWSTSNGPNYDEEFGKAFTKTIKENNLSWCNYAWSEIDANGNKFATANNGAWDGELNDSVLCENGKFVKRLLQSYEKTDTGIVDAGEEVANKMIPRNWQGESIWSEQYRENITSIQFDTLINIPENAAQVFDMGDTIGTNVKAYIIENSYSSENDKKYDLHIQANGKVYAPDDCYYLFQGFFFVNNIDFTNCVVTPKTQNMCAMFGSVGTGKDTGSAIVADNVTINLGDDFDTSGVNNMYEMFAYVGQHAKKVTIKFGKKFDTQNVEDMGGMFTLCGQMDATSTFDLTALTFGSKLTQVANMFNGWENLCWVGQKRKILVKDQKSQEFVLSQLSSYTTEDVLIKK